MRRVSESLFGGAVIIAIFSVLSRILGLARDNIFAKFFGASVTLDAYNAAFKIPDLIFNFVVLGALSASFVPVFLEHWQKNKTEAWKMAAAVLNILWILTLVLVVFAWIAAPYFVENIFFPGKNKELWNLATQYMRIMLLGVLFFTVSNVFAGILHSFRRFFAYSLAPIFYNLGIIAGAVFLVPWLGQRGLAYGVVLGAALHMLVQLPAVIQAGFTWRPFVSWNTPGVSTLFSLMLPRSISLGLAQLNIFIIALLALRLPEGSLTMWTWADNLQSFPINVFGVSLAISMFPVFSQAFADKNHEKFREDFSLSLRRILFFVIPLSVAILLLRAQLVRVVLGSFNAGKFDWETTIQTANTLGFFALSLFAQAVLPLLIRSFFAQKDTRTPVMVSFLGVALNALFGWYFSRAWGLYGLALAFSLASIVEVILLFVFLRMRIGHLDDRGIFHSTVKIIIASFVCGLALHGMKYLLIRFVDMQTFVGIFTQTVLSFGVFVFFYFYLAWRFRFDEWNTMEEYFKKLQGLFSR